MARTIEERLQEVEEELHGTMQSLTYCQSQLTALIALCEDVVDADATLGGAGDAIEALHDWLMTNNPDRQG